MMENNTDTITALKDAFETIEWAMDNLVCSDDLVETWGNRYMNALNLVENELHARGVRTRPEPDPSDLPF